jgi:predicted lipoprotein with Yx(FWY)xxD motif
MSGKAYSRRWRTPAAIVAIALLIGAIMVGWGPGITNAQEAESHPAHIHNGSCGANLGDVVYPLDNVGGGTMMGTPVAAQPAAGASDAIPVETSVTKVKTDLASLLSKPYAINVHESKENIGNYIACGNIGGSVQGSDLAIGLAELNNSGYSGVAELHDNGDGTTTVIVFLTEEYGKGGEAEGTPAGASGTAESGTTVQIADNAKLGKFLTDSNGMTLYLYKKDTPGTSNCYDKCAENWPPFITTGGDLSLPAGVPGKLDTTTRKDGSKQITYNGMPLYFFIKDKKAGDTNGQDIGDVWYVVPPAAASDNGTASANAQKVSVTIKDFAFNPDPLEISVGTTVTWTNEDTVPHTATGNGNTFTTPTINQGQSESVTFTKAGTYEYHCEFHANMHGTIVVK